MGSIIDQLTEVSSSMYPTDTMTEESYFFTIDFYLDREHLSIEGI